MGIDFAWNPRIPWSAIHEGVPGIVAGMVGLRSFFPTSGYGAFHGWVFFVDVIQAERIEEIRRCGFWIETEFIKEHRKHVIDDFHLSLFVKHPYAEIFGMVFLSELFAWQAQ